MTACMLDSSESGNLNRLHVDGTRVPVEEPSTASKADSCSATKLPTLRAHDRNIRNHINAHLSVPKKWSKACVDGGIQHALQKNHYIKKIISAAGDVRFGSEADIATV